jgi:hypothetical protein
VIVYVSYLVIVDKEIINYKKSILFLIYIVTKLTYLKNNNMKFYILLQFISSIEINNIILIIIIKLELT